jgi:hypothetical protein
MAPSTASISTITRKMYSTFFHLWIQSQSESHGEELSRLNQISSVGTLRMEEKDPTVNVNIGRHPIPFT